MAIRIRLPSALAELVHAYASKLGINVDSAAHVLLAQVDALVAAGDVPWLSADWRALVRAKEDVELALPADFDGAVLHRSDRTKSGYVGVYANGAGFRATGRAGVYLGTFKTAELAAWHRYRHYQQHGLPYGELEIEIDLLRKQGTQGSDAELRQIVLETARHTGTLHLYTGEGGSSPQPAGFAPGELEAAQAALDGDQS